MKQRPAIIGFLNHHKMKDTMEFYFIMGFPGHKIRIDFEVSTETWNDIRFTELFEKYFTEVDDYDRAFSQIELEWPYKPKISDRDLLFAQASLYLDNPKAESNKDQFNVYYTALMDWDRDFWAEVTRLYPETYTQYTRECID